jgi:hypothetical protein
MVVMGAGSLGMVGGVLETGGTGKAVGGVLETGGTGTVVGGVQETGETGTVHFPSRMPTAVSPSDSLLP